MEWLLTNPQIHSTFSSIGTLQDDNYTVNPNALEILKEINCKLSCEDQTLRTYRRAVGFGQKVKLDLVPLLIHTKDSEIVDTTISILVNLTIPVECLFSVDVMYRTEMGRHTIFEINNLLLTSKEAFTDSKCTKAVVDRIKSILESDTKLSPAQCNSVNNCLLLLRNILHIPEHNSGMVLQGHHNGGNGSMSMQNTIIWNLFIQSIDKLLIYLMTCQQKSNWGVTIVQLIALMYKDQHVSTLQKLLSVWFEASLSESSEDNESNTSPPKQGSGDSSPMLTSDPTSDSSDNGGCCKQECAEDRRQANLNKETEKTLQQVSRKGQEYQNAMLRASPKQQLINQQNQSMGPPKHPVPSYPNSMGNSNGKISITKCETKQYQQQVQNNLPLSPTYTQGSKSSHFSNVSQMNPNKSYPQKRECPSSQSELSDCGYGTQVENQESISTSSNEDDGPQKKPIHQKPPCNQKQRNKTRTVVTMQDKKEWRRKKLVKRSKSNLINMKGLVQHIPTDDDISNILKEFTVDFLLKGYGHLVHELHAQLLSDLKIQMDTSHFFWLVTYFLKFAAQLELDLEHISSVLSFDVVSFLTYEGVILCEQLELTSRQEGSDLKPYLRRMHLVVTAIREFLQALETYKKITHLSKEDKQHLRLLQIQICSTEDFRCLFVLLIRTYNPALHSKQYLQDLVVTNHIFLLLLDGVSKSDSGVSVKMMDHIAQFATVEIMHHYGLLLEDFYENGEFVNDCIFTMMHHIGGDLGQVATLFQPTILKTYSRIWEAEFEICDDWSDLIEYVIHKFMNTPQKSQLALPSPSSLTEITKEHNMEHAICTWNQEEMDTLYWYYVQSKKSKDIVGKIMKLFSENGNKQKSRISIIQQLLQQDIITLIEYDDLMKFEDAEYQRNNTKMSTISASTGESGIEIKDSVICKSSDDIQVLKDRLLKEHKGKMLIWLQKVLIECCFVKLNISAEKKHCKDIITDDKIQIMEPVPHHCILKKKSIPIIPWNSDQSSVMLYQPFVLLLHKLGFHLSADSGKVYIRIPDFWTADILYNIATKLGPINKSFIKFDINLLDSNANDKIESTNIIEENAHENFAIPNIKYSNSIIRFTPDPSPTPLVPNWLQLVIKSKCSADRSLGECETKTAINSSFLTSSSNLNDENLSMKSTPTMAENLDCYNSSTNNPNNLNSPNNNNNNNSTSGNNQQQFDDIIQTRRNSNYKNLDSEYSAIIASVYESKMFDCKTESVASDLTRMYVSDEEDKD